MKKYIKLIFVFTLMFLLSGVSNVDALVVETWTYEVGSTVEAKRGELITVYTHLFSDCMGSGCSIWPVCISSTYELKDVLELVAVKSDLDFKIDEKTKCISFDSDKPYPTVKNLKKGALLYYATYKVKDDAPLGKYTIGRLPGYKDALPPLGENSDFDSSIYETVLTIVDDNVSNEKTEPLVEEKTTKDDNNEVVSNNIIYVYILSGVVVILLGIIVVMLIKNKKQKSLSDNIDLI